MPEEEHYGVDRLTCGFCGHETFWPEQNIAQMMVYGMAHVAQDCKMAPVEVRAEAIVQLEAARRGELI